MSNILSLFDGMSCGQIGLNRAGIKYNTYYSSEIDKYGIAVTQNKYPNTVQLGDVEEWKSWNLPNIDLIMGGFPCQGFSKAGKGKAFDDPRSNLFFTMVDIINHYKPKYFLLENVKMKKEWINIITEYIGVEPIEINSSLVSAQNRKRLYRVGKLQDDGSYVKVNIKPPKDKGILLKDILEDEVDEKFYLSEIQMEKLRKYESNSRLSPLHGKSYCLNTMQGGHRQPKIVATQVGQSKSFGNAWGSDKGYTIKSNTGHGCIKIGEEKYVARKLTPLECERLQTVPDNYTLVPHPVYKKKLMSNTQRYKMLGNGWTVDVIAHIFKHFYL